MGRSREDSSLILWSPEASLVPMFLRPFCFRLWIAPRPLLFPPELAHFLQQPLESLTPPADARKYSQLLPRGLQPDSHQLQPDVEPTPQRQSVPSSPERRAQPEVVPFE